jgi:acetyl-CoA carboxylase biotin carboxyl carrier protein|tara:strand:+ start:433 stop:801 length:369 start_codon:yes stop_codon:yes gene_type:complete
MEIDKKIIKKLIDALEDLKKSLNKNGEQIEISEIKSNDDNSEIEDYKSVKSPIIGTAYLAPEPGAKPFVEVGKKIKKGDTVMIVEAMKTMNHVPSSHDGIVKKISVEDGQPVEYDQILILVE